ncbi:MAG: hypothetical protein ACPG8W_26130 [Candidatus Promineifilaceae bacterium]
MHYQSYPTNELKVVKSHYRSLEGKSHDIFRTIRIDPLRALRNALNARRTK